MSEFWERANRDTTRGEITDGDTRYVMFRTDVVAATVNQLSEEARVEVLKSFAKAVETHGGKSLARYFDMVDRNEQALLDTVTATAPQLGWGVWHFSREENSLRLDVKNSPYVAFEPPENGKCCAPILGMFTALAKMILGEATAEETRCSKDEKEVWVFLARVTSS